MTRLTRLGVLRIAFMIGCLALASPGYAQNWSADARRIGMGGVKGQPNLSTSMIESPEGTYTTIVIPLGLFQVLEDLDIYNPDSDQFDPIRAAEYVAAPLHYTFDRNGTGTGIEFINDLLDGQLNRDLNSYKGFIPTTQPVAYGLGAPSFGITIPLFKRDKTMHGVYVGAGPYIPVRGSIEVDERLTDILASDTDVYVPNTSFSIGSSVRLELPIAITGGYRGRFELWAPRSDRDGLYIAYNYSYIRGFHYDDVSMVLRLDTGPDGLLTVPNPALPPPISVLRLSSDEGRGYSMDVGASAVVNRFEFGFGVNRIANRIKWNDVEAVGYTLGDILTGDGDFTETSSVVLGELTVKQPVEYVTSLGYHGDHWRIAAEAGRRVSDFELDEGRLPNGWLHAGVEYRFTIFEPRAGTYYSRDRWYPTFGLGLNFGKFGFDSALYWNDANVERLEHPSLAFSLRIGSRTR
jgi:hypothetical protein